MTRYFSAFLQQACVCPIGSTARPTTGARQSSPNQHRGVHAGAAPLRDLVHGERSMLLYRTNLDLDLCHDAEPTNSVWCKRGGCLWLVLVVCIGASVRRCVEMQIEGRHTVTSTVGSEVRVRCECRQG
jgi:hypothetical protein